MAALSGELRDPERIQPGMRHLLWLMVVAASAAAQSDPLQAPECRAALTALQAAEQGASGPPLQDARARAARACLGSRADPPPAARRAEPPVVVPPLQLPPARVPAPLPAPAAAPAARPLPPPAVLTCDAHSCLTTDGQRLLRSGPTLIGPQGQCTVQANVVVCP